jgi:hypothetical protein
MLLFLTLVTTSTLACTGVFAHDETHVLFGNNEDYYDPLTYIWTLSAAGAYDRVCLGFGNFFAQGCLNERGLCYDGFATVSNPVTPNPLLPDLPDNYLDIIMSSFATVEEVADYLLAHSRTRMENYQIFFADSTGNSMIAEGDSLVWTAAIVEGDSLVWSERDWQACTNFYQTEPEIGGWPSWRYETATAMLESMTQLDHDYFRDILDACQQSITLYSNIFDLRQKTLRIFHQRDFSAYVDLTFAQAMEEITTPMRISDLMLLTSVQDGEQSEGLELLDSYPNPFFTTTTLRINLTQAETVKLEIFDLQGRLISTLADGEQASGLNIYHWNARDAASGVYFARWQSARRSLQTKLLLVR